MNDERRPPITPQLALRVAVLGGVALVLFAIVFFRLWYLQVLSGDQYVVQANNNQVRDIRIPAPRGEILDRNGTTIVANRAAMLVQLKPESLPQEERDAAAEWGQQIGQAIRRARQEARRAEIERAAPRLRAARTDEGRRSVRRRAERAAREAADRAARRVGVDLPAVATPELERRYADLAAVLGMRPETVHRRVIEQLAVVPYADVTLRTDVTQSVRNYLLERRDRYPGVDVERVYLRDYPRKELAAQLLGTVGEVNPDQLKLERFRDVRQGAIVGQSGIEWSYDRYLRGRDGARRLQVDAMGRPKGELAHARRDPIPGRQVRLSLDLGLQEVGQDAMAALGGGLPGAFVALNPRNGQVYAMGSYPSFDPNIFTRPISPARLEALNSEDNGAPLFNRAIAAGYPAASTFKVITSLAGLDAGLITPSTVIADGGCMEYGGRDWCNAGKVANGPVALVRALEVSSDIYYYVIGRDANAREGQPLQTWTRKLGIGRPTGIDLPGEFSGNVPDRKWREQVGERERRCRRRNGGRPCGISDMRPWSAGDNMNLSVGQGDLQATPLQMAVVYATIAANGRVPRPRLGLEVQDSAGRLVQRIRPAAARRERIPAEWRDPIMAGLRAAASGSGGTSTPVFASWPHDRLPVHGKTGTAETFYKGVPYDQSWYVAYVPHPDKPIVVATTVERGGFGAERAAPIACRILAGWFDTGRGSCEGGGGARD